MQTTKTGREKQIEALDKHRVTQAPLDPGGETRIVTLRLPAALLARVDAAVSSQTRSEWIRAAIEAALD